MRKVLIPQVPTRFDQVSQRRVPSIDLNPARQYGEFVELTKGNGSVEELRESMRHATDDDVILCVGDVVLVAAAIAMANDMFGRALLLRWDRNKKSYDFMEVHL